MRKGDLYFVVGEDGKKHSKKGLSKAMARKQRIALNIAHAKKEGYDIPRMAKSKIVNPQGIATAEQINDSITMKEARRLQMELMEKENMSLKDRIDALKEDRKVHKMEEKVEMPTIVIKLKKKVDKDEKKLELMEFSKMTQPERKKMYEKFVEDGKLVDDVPSDVRRGYKIFLTKSKK
jgi:hypothetical protein